MLSYAARPEGALESERVIAGVENRSLALHSAAPSGRCRLEKLTQAKAWAMLSCPFRAQNVGDFMTKERNF